MRLIGVGILTVLLGTGANGEPNQSHREKATELLLLIGAERQAMAGAAAMAEAMLQGNPMLAPYRDVLLEWTGNVMTWENMEPAMVEIYVDTYTEQELSELIEFYTTPLGKKTLEVTPELVRRSALVGGGLAERHQAELEAMIRERAAKLESFQPDP